MSVVLSPVALGEISHNINQVLTDTFHMMFNMDVSLLAKHHPPLKQGMIFSHIDMSHVNATAFMTVAINRHLAESLASKLDPDTQPPLSSVVQDIVCEINNIAGNHLRAYLCSKAGMEFKLSLPRPGHAEIKDKNTQDLTMQFLVGKIDNLDLEFSYVPKA